METETKKWWCSPTRVSNYRALTGKILVFLTGGRINRFDCINYTLTALMKWDLTTRWRRIKVLCSRSLTTYWPTPKEIEGNGGGGGELETYQLLSTNKAAQRSPFLAVYEPGSGGLVLNSAWRSSISFSNWPPVKEKKDVLWVDKRTEVVNNFDVYNVLSSRLCIHDCEIVSSKLNPLNPNIKIEIINGCSFKSSGEKLTKHRFHPLWS